MRWAASGTSSVKKYWSAALRLLGVAAADVEHVGAARTGRAVAEDQRGSREGAEEQRAASPARRAPRGPWSACPRCRGAPGPRRGRGRAAWRRRGPARRPPTCWWWGSAPARSRAARRAARGCSARRVRAGRRRRRTSSTSGRPRTPPAAFCASKASEMPTCMPTPSAWLGPERAALMPMRSGASAGSRQTACPPAEPHTRSPPQSASTAHVRGSKVVEQPVSTANAPAHRARFVETIVPPFPA